VYHLTDSVDLRVSLEDAFKYYTDLKHVVRMAPPGLNLRVKKAQLPLRSGSKVLFSTRPRMVPFEMEWLFHIVDFVPNVRFSDELLRGPVSHWVHRHEFAVQANGLCRITDTIEFAPPTGILGALLPPSVIRPRLKEIFHRREEVLRRDLEKGS
jgi:ligand-binding SRPBCC domain-containing protein